MSFFPPDKSNDALFAIRGSQQPLRNGCFGPYNLKLTKEELNENSN
jgi:hypothetical protein